MRTPESAPTSDDAVPHGPGRRFLAQISDFLLPQRCLVCGGFGASLHPTCVDTLPAADGRRCARCWQPSVTTWCERCANGGADAPAFDALRTPFRFEGDARRALLEAKFRGVTTHLGVLALAAAEVVPASWRADVVVPVPLHRGRERRRGYNQSAILARGIAEALGAREHRGLLRRSRAGVPQASLTAVERARNARGTYEVRGVPPPRVLVVDDVTTTGSTLDSIAAALKAAGAERVYAVAVARED